MSSLPTNKIAEFFKYSSGLYELLELSKDFYYFYAYDHINFLTASLLLLTILFSLLLFFSFVIDSDDDHSMVEEIKEAADLSIKILLIGNKSDLEEKR